MAAEIRDGYVFSHMRDVLGKNVHGQEWSLAMQRDREMIYPLSNFLQLLFGAICISKRFSINGTMYSFVFYTKVKLTDTI